MKDFTKKRISALEKQLNDLYKLLSEYEDILNLDEDPKRLMKAQKVIDGINQRIENIQKEMATISEKDLSYHGDDIQQRQTLESFNNQIEAVIDNLITSRNYLKNRTRK
ncbi:MAG: hypothetical protein HC831_18150 [Chloroflexia bacterium]|nr:hypothetical protein [Chloroflexia bacterium]